MINTSTCKPVSSTVYEPEEYYPYSFKFCVNETREYFKMIYNVEHEKMRELNRKLNNKISGKE
jgi:hypothetical protein